MKALILALALSLTACATTTAGPQNPPGTNANDVASIQKSCDDQTVEKTYINGKAYMCGDYATVQSAITQMLQMIQKLQTQHGA
jgi:starvation-inducible outer membrane lipoprotein